MVRSVVTRLRLAASAVLGAAALLTSFAPPTAAGAQPPVHYRKIGDTPGFPRLRDALQRIVDESGHARENTFCVMLADRGDGDPLAFAIWTQRRLLYRWRQTRGPQLDDEALVLHVPLDLRKDIVRTRADEASTYLVTRAWVRDVERQCRQHGETMAITRGAR